MKNYYRLMLGRKSIHAEACFAGGFIGTDFGMHLDLTGRLPDEWRDFNKEFIPIYLENRPHKTKIAAGLACGAIWTVSKCRFRRKLPPIPEITLPLIPSSNSLVDSNTKVAGLRQLFV